MSSDEQGTGIQRAGRRSAREDWRGALRAQGTALLVGLGILGAGYWLVMRPIAAPAPAPAAPPIAVEALPASRTFVLHERGAPRHRSVTSQRLSFIWVRRSDM